MTTDGGNGGKPVAPPRAAEPEGRHPADLVREGFFNLFVDAMRLDAERVAVIPLDAMTTSIKLGKPTAEAAKLQIRLHRGTAMRMKGPEDERDVVVVVVVPRPLIEKLQKPTLYGPDGETRA